MKKSNEIKKKDAIRIILNTVRRLNENRYFYELDTLAICLENLGIDKKILTALRGEDPYKNKPF